MDKPHKRLEAWRLSMELVEDVYRITERFPPEERFGLVQQIRRAAVSIPCNIAEGAARHTRKEFINFLHMSQGSLSELDTLLELSSRLQYLDLAEWHTMDLRLERIDKMPTGLIGHQRRKGHAESTSKSAK